MITSSTPLQECNLRVIKKWSRCRGVKHSFYFCSVLSHFGLSKVFCFTLFVVFLLSQVRIIAYTMLWSNRVLMSILLMRISRMRITSEIYVDLVVLFIFHWWKKIEYFIFLVWCFILIKLKGCLEVKCMSIQIYTWRILLCVFSILHSPYISRICLFTPFLILIDWTSSLMVEIFACVINRYIGWAHEFLLG